MADVRRPAALTGKVLAPALERHGATARFHWLSAAFLGLELQSAGKRVDTLARDRKGASFTALAKDDKVQLLNEQGFVLPLAFQAYIAYYGHTRVAAGLGLEARPPHPIGYQLKPNDLSLLDAVRRRPKGYREC